MSQMGGPNELGGLHVKVSAQGVEQVQASLENLKSTTTGLQRAWSLLRWPVTIVTSVLSVIRVVQSLQHASEELKDAWSDLGSRFENSVASRIIALRGTLGQQQAALLKETNDALAKADEQAQQQLEGRYGINYLLFADQIKRDHERTANAILQTSTKLQEALKSSQDDDSSSGKRDRLSQIKKEQDARVLAIIKANEALSNRLLSDEEQVLAELDQAQRDAYNARENARSKVEKDLYTEQLGYIVKLRDAAIAASREAAAQKVQQEKEATEKIQQAQEKAISDIREAQNRALADQVRQLVVGTNQMVAILNAIKSNTRN